MRNYKSISILFFIVLVLGCDDYLDITPKTGVILENLEDYDLLLNGDVFTIYATSDAAAFNLSADDFSSSPSFIRDLTAESEAIRLYTWDENVFKSDQNQLSWNLPYQNLYNYNKVINEIDDASLSAGYTENDRKVIKAEAKLGRAFEYFMLVNAFGKAFSATSESDLGVPLVTVADIVSEIPNRSSVKQVYDFILQDVLEALPNLPDIKKNSSRPDKASGHAFLARIYLYMGDYPMAKIHASEAIDIYGTIQNYNNATPFSIRDVIYLDHYMIREASRFIFNEGFLSKELLNLYTNNDTRLRLLFRNFQGARTQAIQSNFFVSIPEMYLIRAECNARLESGSIQEIISDLDEIRKNRLPNYKGLAPFASKDEALFFVIDEKRREMSISGLRFFDLKRLNTDPKTAKVITHEFDLNGDGTISENEKFSLEPNSNNYALPIPSNILALNPGLTQNPRD